MTRIHAFEFLDKPWLPSVLRDSMVAYLEAMYRLGGKSNAVFAAKIAGVMKTQGTEQVLDLCSGGSGPILHLLPYLRENLGKPVDVTLTDLFPPAGGRERIAALNDPHIRYRAEPVDATRPPAGLAGVRTIFGGFHHFTPELAQQCLAGSFADRRPIVVFEVTARKPPLFVFALLLPILTLFFTLAVRPLRPGQIFFTYVIPLLPLLIAWDGFISVLRTYTVEELTAMTATLQAPDYAWEIGEMALPGAPVKIPYLVGQPKKT